MSYVLWILLSIVAYIGGLVIIGRMTPLLLARAYDEGLFLGIAAADIIGAMLVFAAVVIPVLLFNAALAIRIIAVLLLLGILLMAARQAVRSFRPRVLTHTNRVSRIIVGCYCLFLALGAIYYIIQLFTV
ncbi:MAG TPA: hypothetical protein VKX46_00295 [Ktedonobacteraceae bacterium]|nr:hypothetical protein [Ktedonobacteraceae bacterium]